MRKNKVKKLVGVTGTLLAAAMFVPIVLASTQTPKEFKATISVDNQVVSHPVAVQAMDGNTLTTYLPIWYIMGALKAAGYVATWDSVQHSLNLESTVPGNYYQYVSLGAGNAQISVNGALVKKLNDIVMKDPAGGAHAQETVYMPIYYVDQVLQSLGESLTWNGTAWNMSSWAGVTQLKGTQPESRGVQSVAVGTPDQLIVTATKGGTITIPWSQVTSSIQGPAGASIDANGNFTAVTPGQYTVTESFGHSKSNLTIDVYGQPAGVDVQPNFTSLAADGHSSDAITVKVVDQNGNVVSDFNGTVKLSINSSGGTLGNNGVVDIHNGIGSVLLTAPSFTPSQPLVISSSNLTSDGTLLPATIQYGVGCVEYTAIPPTIVGDTGIIHLDSPVPNQLVKAGSQILVSGTVAKGFENQTLQVTLFSGDVKPSATFQVQDFKVGSDGKFNGSFTIPSNLPSSGTNMQIVFELLMKGGPEVSTTLTVQ